MLCSQKKSSLHGFLHRRSTDGQNIKISRSKKTTFSLLWVLWRFETYFIACPLDDYIWLDFIFCAGNTSFLHFMEGLYVIQIYAFISGTTLLLSFCVEVFCLISNKNNDVLFAWKWGILQWSVFCMAGEHELLMQEYVPVKLVLPPYVNPIFLKEDGFLKFYLFCNIFLNVI